MSIRPPKGPQIDTINRGTPFTQLTLDLKKVDAMANSYGVDFAHYKAIPSPIGQKDRGDYRRSDGVDTITSNGMIYTCAGQFTATMIDNTTKQQDATGGSVEASEARLVLPRFYNASGEQANGARIHLHPGDRVYIADLNADARVVMFHKMDYSPYSDNVATFPICEMEMLIDSLGKTYTSGVDFNISSVGNIHWLPGGSNPGIDIETGKGRVYSVRYLYTAYWYIVALPKEVRITNTTTGGIRSPERMPYHAVLQREYVFHQQNRGDALNQNATKTPERAGLPVPAVIIPDPFTVPVDMSAISDDGSREQS